MDKIDEKTKKTVLDEFKKLQNPVRILFFSQEMECGYCADAHKILDQIVELNPLLSLSVFDFVKDAEQVKQYKIEMIPGIVVLAGEEDFGFRYYGVPTGYEFATLVNIIILASKRDSGLQAKVKEDLKKIINEIAIKVFVIPTCPRCPKAALVSARFAFENRNLKVSIIEAAEYPLLVQKYGVKATPKVVINETLSFDGALPEPLFLQYLLHAQGHLLEEAGKPVGNA
jgi:glutaredoxin-like protein